MAFLEKIPEVTRQLWWEKFESKYEFIPLDHVHAQNNFEKQGATLLKNLLAKARKSRVKPKWIEEVVWDALCLYWDTDVGFLQKSAQG
ncbi:hypothetical protein PIB30_091307 [Stylosanthes scabra]|uniref:Uncharacterized protein n=1 Tax=Stylosanthes scabra TaxID=79078 RepID=A0ABU6SUY7_9FABA|nr:hypothetical protein [Stylosanthes scabra]